MANEKTIGILSAEIERLEDLASKLQPRSYQETGVGGRKYDEAVLAQIDRLAAIAGILDEAADQINQLK
ncbi:MAG: hypothetical protein GY753_09880 [Gammaproteobacteria bacterium]|nr:hypothetical protein [Gammaproteobacteria bacterium]